MERTVRIKLWVPAFVWMAVIFLFSTDLFSASNTEPILETLLKTFFPAMPAQWIAAIHGGVRKSAHMAAYFTLSWFYLFGLTGSFSVSRRWSPEVGAAAFLLAVAYACSDEWHQSFSPMRTAAVADVGWDGAGALACQAFFAWKKFRGG